jgi:CHAT domain-containing protein
MHCLSLALLGTAAFLVAASADAFAGKGETFNTNSDSSDLYQRRSAPHFHTPRSRKRPQTTPPSPAASPADGTPPLPVRAEFTAAVLHAEADALKHKGKYADAGAILHRLLRRQKAGADADGSATATTLYRLGGIAEAVGELDEAEAHHREALAIAEKTSGPDHPDTARILDRLASLHAGRLEHAEAERLWTRARAIREKAFGADHPEMAESLDTLAYLRMAARRLGDAEQPLKDAIAIREKHLGPDHPDTAASLSRMAVLLQQQERIGEFEPVARRALEIREKSLGPDHPLVATSLERLAGLYVAKKQFEAVDPLLARALSIKEKALGPEHRMTLQTLDLIAALNMLGRDFDAAEMALNRAKEARERRYGPDHLEVAISLELLANLSIYRSHFSSGDPNAPFLHYSRALAIREKAYGRDSPRIVDTLLAVARAAPTRSEADALFMRAIAIQERALGPAHLETIETYTSLIGRYARRDDFDEADALTAKVIAKVEAAQGDNAPALVKVLDVVAQLYNPPSALVKPRQAEAEPLMKRALALREQTIGTAHPEIAERCEALAKLLDELNRQEDAERFYLRSLDTTEKLYGADDHRTLYLAAKVGDHYKNRQRYPEAEQLYIEHLRRVEKQLRSGASILQYPLRLNELAEVYGHLRQLPKMEEIYRNLLGVTSQRNSESIDHAHLTGMLATFYAGQKRFAEAEKLYLEQLAIYEKLITRGGPENAHLITMPVGHLDEIYTEEKRSADAVALYRRVVSISEKAYGPDAPELLPSLERFAVFMRFKAGVAERAEQESVLKRILAIAERQNGPDAQEVVGPLDRLAEFYIGADRKTAAEPLLVRALAIMEKTEVPDANELSSTLNTPHGSLAKLGTLYLDLKRFDDASRLFRRGLDRAAERRGSEHYETIPWLLTLAKVDEGRLDDAKAEALLKRACAIEERSLLSDRPNPISEDQAYYALDAFYDKRERDADREAFLKRRLAVEEQSLAAGRMQYPHAAGALALLYRGQRRYAEVEAVLKREVALWSRVGGLRRKFALASLQTLATFYNQQGREADAVPILEQIHQEALKAFGPEDNETLRAATDLARVYARMGRYADAEKLYKNVLAIGERQAPRDPSWFYRVGAAVEGLSRLYDGLGRSQEIEPLYKRISTFVDTVVLASAGQNVAETHGKAVEFYREHRRFGEAVAVAARWLALKEPEADPAGLLGPVTHLGQLYSRLADYRKAEPLLQQAVSLAETVRGTDSMEAVDLRRDLARLYRNQGRYREAEPHVLQALAIEEAALAKSNASPGTALIPRGSVERATQALLDLAFLRLGQERYQEGEAIMKRVIEQRLRSGFSVRISGHFHLGNLYRRLGRYAEAEPLLVRALSDFEAYYGKGHPDTQAALGSVGEVYLYQGRHAQAEPLLEQALSLSEKVNGPIHPDTLLVVGRLGSLRRNQGRYDDAELLLRRQIAGYEKVYGPQDDSTIGAVRALLALYLSQNQLGKAEPLAQRVRDIDGKGGQSDEWEAIANKYALAGLEGRKGNWLTAWQLSRSAAAGLIARARKRHTEEFAGQQDSGDRSSGQQVLWTMVRNGARLAGQDMSRAQELASESFEAVQWAGQSQVAAAVAQTAARFAKGDDQLAGLVRRRQDLVGRFTALDGQLVTKIATEKDDGYEPRERLRQRQSQIWDERNQMEKQIGEIDKELAARFPDYAALANPEPLSLTQTQAQLRSGDALYHAVFLDDEAYAWVVTKDAVRWQILPVAARTVSEAIDALRCGLDSSAWETGAQGEGARPAQPAVRPCRELLGRTAPGAQLPFDLGRAHGLYKALFAPFDDVIRDKHLIVVPGGKLATVPFHALVTSEPDPSVSEAERYARAEWLAKRQPVTVLPSVASLKALRASRRRVAPRPYVGFGNPLLAGSDSENRGAWARKDCTIHTASLGQTSAAGQADRTAAIPDKLQTFFRGGLGDVKLIRQQEPLPETADELCSVGQALGASDDDVFLGARATEKVLKGLSEEGRLGTARVVHFATHGLIGGETEILTRSRIEPALILTPPDEPSDEDDGLLTASEAAQLKLNADMVILSACNTAAGDGKAGEALSGLARAFFYAGSRALLASHWYVNSNAAVDLVTGMVAEMSKKGAGRAEALRRSMMMQVRSGGYRAHPSYWAPFVLVGDGE